MSILHLQATSWGEFVWVVHEMVTAAFWTIQISHQDGMTFQLPSTLALL